MTTEERLRIIRDLKSLAQDRVSLCLTEDELKKIKDAIMKHVKIITEL